MSITVFHIVILVSILGPVFLQGDDIAPYKPNFFHPLAPMDGGPEPTDDKPMTASCEKIFNLITNWQSYYGRFIVGVVGDEIRVIFIDDMTYLSGEVADQTDENVLVLNSVGEFKNLKEHENYKASTEILEENWKRWNDFLVRTGDQPVPRTKYYWWSPWLHHDADGKYLSLCAKKLFPLEPYGDESKLGLVWNLETDTFVRRCRFEMCPLPAERQAIINDNHPRLTFIIDGVGERRSFVNGSYNKQKFADTQESGFDFGPEFGANPWRFELCVGPSPVTVVSSKIREDIPWVNMDPNCANNPKEFLGKYGGYFFNNKVYLLGMQNVHILEDDVFRRPTNHSAVKQVSYQDFFKCNGDAPQRSAGSGMSTTSWIIIGIIVAIVIVVLILCCVFGIKRKKMTGKSSGRQEKSRSNKSNQLLRPKSGSSKKLKSRRSYRSVKSSSRSLKKLNQSSRESYRKSKSNRKSHKR